MEDKLTVTLDELDLREAYRPAARHGRLSALVLTLAVMLALLIVALLIRFPVARSAFVESPLIIGLSGAVILAAFLVLALIVAIPNLRVRAARSTLADHPGMRDPIHYSFDPEHLSVRSTYTHARYPWAELWDWRETERVVIVMPSPRNFYVLPKRSIDAPLLNRLRGYLAQSRQAQRRAH